MISVPRLSPRDIRIILPFLFKLNTTIGSLLSRHMATAEASSNLARYDGMHYGHRTKEKADLVGAYSESRSEGFGPEVRKEIGIPALVG